MINFRIIALSGALLLTAACSSFSEQTSLKEAYADSFMIGCAVNPSHTSGRLTQANDLANAVLAQFPNARITIEPTTALCSFYAEIGGLMIGFEGGYNAENDPAKF